MTYFPPFNQYVHELESLSVHSLAVRRHGREIANLYRKPYSGEKQIAYSVSKSFTAIAVLFAVQDGLCRFDTKICDVLADEIDFVPNERVRQATVYDLLTMTYGFYEEGVQKFYLTNDWIKEALSHHLQHEPGSVFFYDNRCPFLCSAIVQKLTGMNLSSYLRMKLFNPLDILPEETAWEMNCQGYDKGSYGLSITTSAMAKFGQFILNRGSWNGVRLLASEYIDMLFDICIATDVNSEYSPDNKLGYSFYFWHCRIDRTIRAEGLFGQFIIILPEQDMVIALQSGIANDDKQAILDATWRFVQAMEQCGDVQRLDAEFAPIELPLDDASFNAEMANQSFSFSANALKINEFEILSADADSLKLRLNWQQKTYLLTLHSNQWQKAALGGKSDDFDSCGTVIFNNPYVAYDWQDGILTLNFVYNQGVFIDYLHFELIKGKLHLHYLPTPKFDIRSAEQTIISD